MYQEAFDATTSLTHNIKKTGQEIMACTTVTDAGMAMVNQSRELMKTLSGPTEVIENILTMHRAKVTVKIAVQALQTTAVPFKNLENFLAELKALHNIYVPKKQKTTK